MAARKSVLIFTVVLLLGLAGGLGEAVVVAQQGRSLAALETQQTALTRELHQLRHETAEAARAIAAQQNLNAATAASAPSPDSAEAKADAWLAKLGRLQQLMAQPGVAIPEMKLLSPLDWLGLARDTQFESDDVRKIQAEVRNTARGRFTMRLSMGLTSYLRANNNELPPDLVTLTPHFNTTIDPAALERYELLATGSFEAVPNQQKWLVREKAPIDEDYDARAGLNAMGITSVRRGLTEWIEDYSAKLAGARANFTRANNGAPPPASLEQIGPYFDPPLPPVTLEKLIAAQRAAKR